MTLPQTPLSLEYILLGFVCQGPIHGYSLYKKISNLEGISLVCVIKQSYLYALLDKLEVVGLLTSKIIPCDTHGIRKEFQITPVGRQTFFTWLTSPVLRESDMRQEFLAKLYFAQKSAPDIFMELVEEQTIACTEWLSSFQTCYSNTDPDHRYERLVFRYRVSQTYAMLEWLNDCLTEIKRASLTHSEAEK